MGTTGSSNASNSRQDKPVGGSETSNNRIGKQKIDLPDKSGGSIHAGSASDYDDIEGMIERGGCSSVYYKMEECLGTYDRDWTKCQETVKALKECNLALQNSKK